MKEKTNKEIKKVLIGLGIINLVILIIAFCVSLYLLLFRVQDNESLSLLITFIIAQLAGLIILFVIIGFFSGYYEYNEYWAHSMWEKLEHIQTQNKEIQKKLED